MGRRRQLLYPSYDFFKGDLCRLGCEMDPLGVLGLNEASDVDKYRRLNVAVTPLFEEFVELVNSLMLFGGQVSASWNAGYIGGDAV